MFDTRNVPNQIYPDSQQHPGIRVRPLTAGVRNGGDKNGRFLKLGAMPRPIVAHHTVCTKIIANTVSLESLALDAPVTKPKTLGICTQNLTTSGIIQKTQRVVYMAGLKKGPGLGPNCLRCLAKAGNHENHLCGSM